MSTSSRRSFVFRFLTSLINAFFILSCVSPLNANAQTPADLGLPTPGAMISFSSAYRPLIIKGMTVHPDNPVLFDFIFDAGDSRLDAQNPQLKAEAQKLVKYFLASLTVPDSDQWVNLSPYEKDRIVPESLGQTEMGRDMLAQDYVLKQLTASLIYPEKQLGQEFWAKVYAKAQQIYGTSEIPVNTFNKVWVVADKADVFVRNNTAFVVNAHLKVMLEEDYDALNKNNREAQSPKGITTKNNAHALGSQMVRELVLPELEREVNEGEHFANLRQIFYSMILSTWYKKNLKEALLNQVYSNKAKVDGVDVADKTIKEQIYQEYLKAYKKGVFNYIKEEVVNGQAVPKKYFSGGVAPNLGIDTAMMVRSAALAGDDFGGSLIKGQVLAERADMAMTGVLQKQKRLNIPANTTLILTFEGGSDLTYTVSSENNGEQGRLISRDGRLIGVAVRGELVKSKVARGGEYYVGAKDVMTMAGLKVGVDENGVYLLNSSLQNIRYVDAAMTAEQKKDALLQRIGAIPWEISGDGLLVLERTGSDISFRGLSAEDRARLGIVKAEYYDPPGSWEALTLQSRVLDLLSGGGTATDDAAMFSAVAEWKGDLSGTEVVSQTERALTGVADHAWQLVLRQVKGRFVMTTSLIYRGSIRPNMAIFDLGADKKSAQMRMTAIEEFLNTYLDQKSMDKISLDVLKDEMLGAFVAFDQKDSARRKAEAFMDLRQARSLGGDIKTVEFAPAGFDGEVFAVPASSPAANVLRLIEYGLGKYGIVKQAVHGEERLVVFEPSVLEIVLDKLTAPDSAMLAEGSSVSIRKGQTRTFVVGTNKFEVAVSDDETASADVVVNGRGSYLVNAGNKYESARIAVKVIDNTVWVTNLSEEEMQVVDAAMLTRSYNQEMPKLLASSRPSGFLSREQAAAHYAKALYQWYNDHGFNVGHRDKFISFIVALSDGHAPDHRIRIDVEGWIRKPRSQEVEDILVDVMSKSDTQWHFLRLNEHSLMNIMQVLENASADGRFGDPEDAAMTASVEDIRIAAIDELLGLFRDPSGDFLLTTQMQDILKDRTLKALLKEKRINFEGEFEPGLPEDVVNVVGRFRFTSGLTKENLDAVIALLEKMKRAYQLILAIKPQLDAINENASGAYNAQAYVEQGHALVQFTDRKNKRTNLTVMIDQGFRLMSFAVNGQEQFKRDNDNLNNLGQGVFIMYPTVNRVENGVFNLDGAARDLKTLEGLTMAPNSTNVMHGFVRNATQWKDIRIVEDVNGVSIQAVFETKDYPGLAAQVGENKLVATYAIKGNELRMDAEVSGRGIADVGFHPFMPYSDGTTLQAKVTGIFPVNADKIPAGDPAADIPQAFDFNQPKAVNEQLDQPFMVAPDADGLVRAVWNDPKRGVRNFTLGGIFAQGPIHFWGGGPEGNPNYRVGAVEPENVVTNAPNRQGKPGGSTPLTGETRRGTFLMSVTPVDAAMTSGEEEGDSAMTVSERARQEADRLASWDYRKGNDDLDRFIISIVVRTNVRWIRAFLQRMIERDLVNMEYLFNVASRDKMGSSAVKFAVTALRNQSSVALVKMAARGLGEIKEGVDLDDMDAVIKSNKANPALAETVPDIERERERVAKWLDFAMTTNPLPADGEVLKVGEKRALPYGGAITIQQGSGKAYTVYLTNRESVVVWDGAVPLKNISVTDLFRIMRYRDGVVVINKADKEIFLAPADKAMRAEPLGGIDLNAENLKMGVSGDRIDIKFDAALIERFKRGDFSGLTPVIINFTPIANVRLLLGLKEDEGQQIAQG